VGFAGYYKAGLWTPLEIRLRGGSRALAGRINVTVADSDGMPCRMTTPEGACQVQPGQETAVTLTVRFGHRSSSLEVEFEVAGHAVATKTFETAAEPDGEQFREALQAQRLLVQLGDQSLGLEEAAALGKVEGRPAAVVARVADAGQLPDRWAGYEGVDTVVLATSRPEAWRNLSADAARVEALDRWVRLGGRLVLSAGSRAGEVFGPGAPLARFAPGRFAGVVPLHQTGALETFARSPSPIPSPAGQPTGLSVARLAAVEGRVEAAESDLPLVIRTPRGFGQVIFLAADLDQPPLAQWSDRKLLAARLLDLPAAEQPLDDAAPGAAYGYNDLAGQLRSALDQFPGVRRVPFFVVALLALAYLLWIGPGDYFFLRRFARRMEWTWATFPAIIVLFAAGACVAAYWLKGDRLRIRQVDLIDVDTDGAQRGTSWLGLFSPRLETFELAVRPLPAEGQPAADIVSTTKLALEPLRPDGQRAAGADATIGWLGLAGDGLGGMYRRQPGSLASMPRTGPYEIAPALDVIRGVPIPIWSSKSFVARWLAAGPAPGVEASLVAEDRVPAGRISNKLAFPLEQCILAHDRWAYDLWTLSAGGSVEIGPATRRIDLETLLAGRPSTFDKRYQLLSEAATPYDPASTEATYVLQAMMFFDAAGGERYTGMANDYQHFVDLSGLLKAGRAILVGHRPASGDHPGARLLRAGGAIAAGAAEEHTTVYRFVLAVTEKQPP
jgi:hypothetical protein